MSGSVSLYHLTAIQSEGKKRKQKNWVKRKKLCVLPLVLPFNNSLPCVSLSICEMRMMVVLLPVTQPHLEAHMKPQWWVCTGMQDCVALITVLVRMPIGARHQHKHWKPIRRWVFISSPGSTCIDGTVHRKHLCSNCPPVLSVLVKNDHLLFPTFGSGRPQRNQQPHKIAAVIVTAFSLMDLSMRCLVSIASIWPGEAALWGKWWEWWEQRYQGLLHAEWFPWSQRKGCIWVTKASLLCRINVHLQKLFSEV